jgi:ketol-acid reductoisomerase
MAKINFGGTEEEVVTRDEFPLDKAREVLKDDVVAVLGYGVQGPAQAMNMRDNGINVIVGQRAGTKNWDKAIADGWVPGETLFSVEEAAEKGTVIQYLLSDAGQRSQWSKIVECLNEGDMLYFSHGFSVTFKDDTGVIPPPHVDVALVLQSTKMRQAMPKNGRLHWASPSARDICSQPRLRMKCIPISRASAAC